MASNIIDADINAVTQSAFVPWAQYQNYLLVSRNVDIMGLARLCDGQGMARHIYSNVDRLTVTVTIRALLFAMPQSPIRRASRL
jgi:hypothetical protein